MRKLLLASFIVLLAMAHNVLDHGVFVDKDDWYSELRNSYAIKAAMLAANATLDGDNTVYIPEGLTISTMPIRKQTYIKGIEIIIDGTLKLSKNYRHYSP